MRKHTHHSSMPSLRYDYTTDFTTLREVHRGAAGVVYAADRDDGFYVIDDESAYRELAEDQAQSLVTIMRFDTAAARDAYCAARLSFLR